MGEENNHLVKNMWWL